MRFTLFLTALAFHFLSLAQLDISVQASHSERCASDTVSLQMVVHQGTPDSIRWELWNGSSWDSLAVQKDSIRYSYTLFTTASTRQIRLRCWSGTANDADSVNILFNPLPLITLREADFCQDKGEFHMADELVSRPANEFFGTQSWACLDCNGNDFANMLVDQGVGIPDYYLKIRKNAYTIQNPFKDTITLEYTFENAYGCINRDTTQVRIWRSPNLDFGAYRTLCWDEGEINLNSLFGTHWNGYWTVENRAGFRDPSELGGIQLDSLINTRKSVELNSPSSRPNAFYMRYHHTETGCYTPRDTFLVINPLPKLVLDPIQSSYCESSPAVSLVASPAGSGGQWSANYPDVIQGGNQLDPALIPPSLHNDPLILRYTYTNPSTGCTARDSLNTKIVPQPLIDLNLDSFIQVLGNIDTLWIDAEVSISFSNATGFTWTAIQAQPQFEALGSGNGFPVKFATRPIPGDSILICLELITEMPQGSPCPAAMASSCVTISRFNLSVGSALATDLILAPNPAHEQLHLQLRSGLAMDQLLICDLAGKEVYHACPNSREYRISTGSWPEGMYFVRLRSGQEWIHAPLMITH